MDKEILLKEHDKFKRNVITFSVLEGVCLFLLIITTFIFTLSIIGNLIPYFENISNIEEVFNEEFFADIILLSLVFICPLAIACDVFIPFIIINAVKLGNRNKALNRLKNN